jgi:hypothetical protein
MKKRRRKCSFSLLYLKQYYMMEIIELDGKMIWFLVKWFNIHFASIKRAEKE